MRNSDPGVSIVSAQRHNSDLNSMLPVQVTGCNFQYRPNFGVSLDPVFRLLYCFFSWKSVFTTGHCMNCEKFPVSVVMKYCPFSTTLRNPASIQNLPSISCCDSFSIRSSYCWNRNFWYAGHHSPKKLLSWSHWARLIVPSEQVVPVLSWKYSYSSHISDTKNSLNRFQIGCIVNRQFTMSCTFELISGQWSRSTENWTSAFDEFHQHLFRNIVPDSLWTALFDRVALFLRTRTNEWPLSFTQFSCIQRYESSVCQTFLFIASCPQEMSLNIDMNRILSVKFSGVSPKSVQ